MRRKKEFIDSYLRENVWYSFPLSIFAPFPIHCSHVRLLCVYFVCVWKRLLFLSVMWSLIKFLPVSNKKKFAKWLIKNCRRFFTRDAFYCVKSCKCLYIVWTELWLQLKVAPAVSKVKKSSFAKIIYKVLHSAVRNSCSIVHLQYLFAKTKCISSELCKDCLGNHFNIHLVIKAYRSIFGEWLNTAGLLLSPLIWHIESISAFGGVDAREVFFFLSDSFKVFSCVWGKVSFGWESSTWKTWINEVVFVPHTGHGDCSCFGLTSVSGGFWSPVAASVFGPVATLASGFVRSTKYHVTFSFVFEFVSSFEFREDFLWAFSSSVLLVC